MKLKSLKLKERENALNEVRLLASIQSEHLVSYKEAFYQVEDDYLCLIMELVEGGSLQEYIDRQRASRQHFPEH